MRERETQRERERVSERERERERERDGCINFHTIPEGWNLEANHLAIDLRILQCIQCGRAVAPHGTDFFSPHPLFLSLRR